MTDPEIIAFVKAMFDLYAAGHTPSEKIINEYLQDFKETHDT